MVHLHKKKQSHTDPVHQVLQCNPDQIMADDPPEYPDSRINSPYEESGQKCLREDSRLFADSQHHLLPEKLRKEMLSLPARLIDIGIGHTVDIP